MELLVVAVVFTGKESRPGSALIALLATMQWSKSKPKQKSTKGPPLKEDLDLIQQNIPQELGH
jgi:hypothetical protein